LSILHQLLQSNHVPETNLPVFLNFLIRTFLQPSRESRESPNSSTFEKAAECLADLSDTRVDNQLLLYDFLASQHIDCHLMLKFLERPVVGEDCSIGKFGRVGLIDSPSHVNAILQQVFALKHLRNAVMHYDGVDPFIIELSRIFFFLYYSQSKAISATSLIVNDPPSQSPYQFLIRLLNAISDFFVTIVVDFPVQNPPSDGILFVRIHERGIIPELLCGVLNLVGVVVAVAVAVVHGSDDDERYNSIVQTERGWLLFDDDCITATDITKPLDPVLLVYACLSHCDPPPRPPFDLDVEITHDNENIQLLQVLCSRGYHHMMERIAARPDPKYSSICLHYAVDTLPFSHIGAEAGQFFDSLVMKMGCSYSEIAEDYLNYLFRDFVIPCIVMTPRRSIRRGHAALIERALATEPQINPILFVEQLISLIAPLRIPHCQIDELFRVLFAFHHNFQIVRDFCIERNIGISMLEFFTVVIPDRIPCNLGIRPQDYYASLDLTHALLFAVALCIPNPGRCQSEYFLSGLALSQTMISAIARFALTYIGKEIVQRFVTTYSTILSINRAVSLMFHAIPEFAVELSLSTRFRSRNSWSNNTDVSSCFIAIANLGVAFECLLFCKLNSWLVHLILDEVPLTRFNAIILIADIIRTDEFGEKYRKPLNWIRQEDGKSAERASYILATMVKIAPELAERVIRDTTRNFEEHRADAYLHALFVLCRISSEIPNLQPLNILYQNLCITQKSPFSRQSTECLQIIANQRSQIEFNILILPFTQLNRQMSKSIADDFCLFAPPLFSLISSMHFHLQFIPIFLRHIMFQKWPVLIRYTSEILNFCQVLIESEQNEMIKEIDEKMERYGLLNFVMMINFYEMVQLKRPILGLLMTVIQKNLLDNKMDLNNLVLRTLNHAEPTVNDRDGLMELQSRDDISEETRIRISGFIDDIEFELSLTSNEIIN
jgi:hypothetical protein